jgi:hypothetical protein
MARFVAVCLLTCALAAFGGGAQIPDTRVVGDWTRFGWDVSRSNAATDPTGINASNVASMRRQNLTIGGTVDASPIYLGGVGIGGAPHDTFFVTTNYGKTIAIDANDGSTLWTYTPPLFNTWVGTYQITSATPVADPGRAFIYTASPDGHIQKLAVADGTAVWSSPITLLPTREKIASSLNFFNGRVIATTGGYVGDAAPYQGHVAVIDAESGTLLHVWNSLCSDRAGLIDPRTCAQSGSAIWGRAGAVIDPVTGNIIVASGNGRWDGKTYWADATLELDPDATRLLGAYTPSNTAQLQSQDQDVGSTSPVLLGGILAQGGKDGTFRLIDRQRLRDGLGSVAGEAQIVSTPSGAQLFSAPAVWTTGGTTIIFVADSNATMAWTLSGGRLVQRWRTTFGGTSPVLADGLLYVYDTRGVLRVYDPLAGTLVASLTCSTGHWNSPVIAAGRIAISDTAANQHQTTGGFLIFRLP